MIIRFFWNNTIYLNEVCNICDNSQKNDVIVLLK